MVVGGEHDYIRQVIEVFGRFSTRELRMATKSEPQRRSAMDRDTDGTMKSLRRMRMKTA